MYSRKPPMNQDIRRQIIARTPCRTYTVQQGDTLSIIAKRFYHTSQRWKDIADANQTQLHGSTHLRVGMSLVIP